MAKSASAANIVSSVSARRWEEPLLHGGDLAGGRRLFPDAPEPFIDLSTGINPNPYPVSRLPGDVFARLPEADKLASLTAIAAQTYGAPSAAHVVAAPGTQILLPLVAALVRPGRTAVLAPSYGEFTRAAALAGHSVAEVDGPAAIGDAQLIFVANPNNPDGRLFTRNDLMALARNLRAHGGLLVVDEAFMDAASSGASLAADVSGGNVVVLRSFGKFFGLAGVRLGFALAAPKIAARLSAMLGPWAVSGPALAVGAKALADAAWIKKTRIRLERSAKKLDGILTNSGLDIVGGTNLFRLVRTDAAGELFDHLGRAGILVRRFPEQANWLRFGLPANARAWRLLQIALAGFKRSG
ncbi:MAG: threonine-phosphate decarboxylase CobD [Xanthobacteraceae bacterium]